MSTKFAGILMAGTYVLLAVAGVIFIKMGLRDSELRLGSPTVISVTPPLAFGLACYIGSFLLWLPVLSRFELSFIFPLLSGLAQVLLLAGSVWLLGENPRLIQWLGVVVIALGIVMLNLGSNA